MSWRERLLLAGGAFLGIVIGASFVTVYALIHHWAISGNTSGF